MVNVIGGGAAFVDVTRIDELLVRSAVVDGIRFDVLSNGMLRVVDSDSLGVIQMRRYASVALALAAQDAAVVDSGSRLSP